MTRDEQLHLYFDGEMSAADKAAFERTLTDKDREKLKVLSQMHDVFVGLQPGLVQPLNIYAAIESRLDNVATQSRSLRDSRRASPRRFGRLMSAPAMAGMFAAAACAAVLLFGPFRKSAPTNGCDVESFEVGGDSAMVMQVDDDKGRETTVLWIEEE